MRSMIYSFVSLCLCLGAFLLPGCTTARTAVNAAGEVGGEYGEQVADEDGPDFLELLREARRNYESINDYTAHFTKQQRIRGKLLPEEEVFIKFRKPYAVYVKWTGKVDRGQEALYVEGKYNDKVIVHKGGFILSHITVSLDPSGHRAMKKNLRPITCAGIGFLIGSLIEVSERAADNNDMKVEYHGIADLPDGEAHRFERYLDERGDYPCYRAVIYLDKETSFPVLYEAYDSKGNILERYTYSNIETEQGLGEEHFDKHNKEYRFGFF